MKNARTRNYVVLVYKANKIFEECKDEKTKVYLLLLYKANKMFENACTRDSLVVLNKVNKILNECMGEKNKKLFGVTLQSQEHIWRIHWREKRELIWYDSTKPAKNDQLMYEKTKHGPVGFITKRCGLFLCGNNFYFRRG